MITLYTWTTPNGRKATIMLEELGIEYQLHPVDLGQKQQMTPAFLAISPNNKIPAIVDDSVLHNEAPLAIFESGAVLTYLAEKYGRFLAPSGPARYQALEWLHWQIGGLGPMLGQLGFFAVRSAEKSALATGHFTTECERLLGVLERRLAEAPYLAGAEYSIADIATYPWALVTTTMLQPVLGASLEGKPALSRWLDTVGRRPAVQRGMALPKTA